jgi:hypothetical protein
MTLLNMLGSVTRKVMRGTRTSYYREWRGRDNVGLGILTLLGIAGVLFLGWMILVPGDTPPARNSGSRQYEFEPMEATDRFSVTVGGDTIWADRSARP